MMLSLRNPTGGDDPRWMTFNQAKEEGYKVKKGAIGVPIVHFKFEDKKLVRDEETGKPILDEKGNKQYKISKLEKPIMTVNYVFHASDIDGIPPLEKKKEITTESIAKSNALAEAIIKNSPAPIKHDQGDRAFYRISEDTIHLPKREQFKSIEGYYGTVIHEIAHSTGHESRWQNGKRRFESVGFGSEEYAREELRAEISSYMIAKKHGIEHDPENHKAYVKSWIKSLKDDPQEIFKAARDAERITDMVYGLAKQKEIATVKELPKDKEVTPSSLKLPRDNGITTEPAMRREFAKMAKEQGLDCKAEISRNREVHKIPRQDGKGIAGIYELRPDGKGVMMNFETAKTVYWESGKGVLKTVENDKRQEQYRDKKELPPLIRAPLPEKERGSTVVIDRTIVARTKHIDIGGR